MIDWTLQNEKAVRFRYTNWRSETGIRTVTPQRIWFGATVFHPEPQWLLDGLDHDKGGARTFALKDCDFAMKGAHLLFAATSEVVELQAEVAKLKTGLAEVSAAAEDRYNNYFYGVD